MSKTEGLCSLTVVLCNGALRKSELPFEEVISVGRFDDSDIISLERDASTSKFMPFKSVSEPLNPELTPSVTTSLFEMSNPGWAVASLVVQPSPEVASVFQFLKSDQFLVALSPSTPRVK